MNLDYIWKKDKGEEKDKKVPEKHPEESSEPLHTEEALTPKGLTMLANVSPEKAQEVADTIKFLHWMATEQQEEGFIEHAKDIMGEIAKEEEKLLELQKQLDDLHLRNEMAKKFSLTPAKKNPREEKIQRAAEQSCFRILLLKLELNQKRALYRSAN